MVFLLKIDRLGNMRLDVAMRESGRWKMVRDIAHMERGVALEPVHMGMRKRCDELREREKNKRKDVNLLFHTDRRL